MGIGSECCTPSVRMRNFENAISAALPDNATAQLWIAKIDERQPPVLPAPAPPSPAAPTYTAPRPVTMREAGAAYALPYIAVLVLAHGCLAVSLLAEAYGGLGQTPLIVAVMALFAFGLLIGVTAILVGMAAILHRLTALVRRS